MTPSGAGSRWRVFQRRQVLRLKTGVNHQSVGTPGVQADFLQGAGADGVKRIGAAYEFVNGLQETAAAFRPQFFFHAVGIRQIPKREMPGLPGRPAHARQHGNTPAVEQPADQVRLHFGEGAFQMARGARHPELLQQPGLEGRLADIGNQPFGHAEGMQTVGLNAGARVQFCFAAIPPSDPGRRIAEEQLSEKIGGHQRVRAVIVNKQDFWEKFCFRLIRVRHMAVRCENTAIKLKRFVTGGQILVRFYGGREPCPKFFFDAFGAALIVTHKTGNKFAG